jgi:DeoR family fructose operon transcriptional repressor
MVFLGANGLSADFGFTTSDSEEAAVKEAMMKSSQENVVLADHTKFGAVFPAVFANPSQIDRLITDIDAPMAQVEALAALGVEVELA